MTKTILSLLTALLITLAAATQPGCTDKEVETHQEVEIEVETIIEQGTVVE